MHEGDEARVVVGVQQVVLEDRELVGVGQGVVLAVDFAEEGVDLRGREFVGIAALHAGDDRVVRLDALPLRLTNKVARDDLLGHGHRPRRRGQGGQVEFARRKALGEGEESTFLEDEARHRIVAGGELLELEFLAVLQALEHRMVAHELSEVDVVPLVDGREGGGDDQANAGPALALRRSFTAGAGALALARDDDLEAAVDERVLLEHALAFVHEASIGVLCDFRRLVVEANPGRRHHVGVDVVEQILDGEVLHAQVEALVELLADELQVFGQEEDAGPLFEADDGWRLVLHPHPRSGQASHLFNRIGRGPTAFRRREE